MSTYPRSPDGAWYWDGRRWVPTGATPAARPAALGHRQGSHWDGSELIVRCARAPFVALAIMFPVLIGMLGLVLSLMTYQLILDPAAFTGGTLLLLLGFLGFMELGIVLLIGCWVYYVCFAVRPAGIHFSGRGILARQPWRGSFYIPWDAVTQVRAHRGVRLLLTVEVSEEFWRYLGRRWMPRWVAPLAFGGPPRGASLIAIPPRRTGMEMADILRCVRQVAPARIPVSQ